MFTISILSASVLLQFAAVFLSLKVVRITARNAGWVFLSGAIFFMAFRRLIPLYHLIVGDISYHPDISAELVELTISFLMIIGFVGIGRFFRETGEIQNFPDENRLPLITAGMFLLLDVFIWLDEILDLPHVLMGAPRTPINWQESLIETVLIVLLGLFVFFRTTYFINQTKQSQNKIEHLNSVLRAIRNVNQLITREKDPERLTADACRHLFQARGYSSVWICLFDNRGKVKFIANAGRDEEFSAVIKKLENGEEIVCQKSALTSEDIVKIDDPLTFCKDCPSKSEYKDNVALISVLKSGERVFGTITVSLPGQQAADKEECDLFKELVGDISFALCSIENEQERKQVEETLKDTAMCLKEAQRVAKVGSWTLDLATNILTWSDEIYRMFEIDPVEFDATYEAFLSRIHPDDREAVDEAYSNSLKTRTPYAIEHRLYFPDGRVKFVQEQCETVYENGRPVRSLGTVQDITGLKLAEKEIRNNLQEKEILLRELYHRTKNNMQVISSMLRLRARATKEEKISDTFMEIENKIMSMALVQQKLYESKDLSQVNLKDYIGSLISLIDHSYSDLMKNITVKTEMKDVSVLIDTAVPVGLIVNELLTNSVKHAFPNGRSGNISVNLDVNPQNQLVIEISDDGVGLPPNFDFQKDIRLGLQSVCDLAEWQLDGEIKFLNQEGLHCRFTLTKELYQPRV